MSASEKLRALDTAMKQGPVDVVVEDGDEWWFGAGEQVVLRPQAGPKWESVVVGGGEDREEIQALAALRNALPLIADVIEAAEGCTDRSYALSDALTALEAHLTPAKLEIDPFPDGDPPLTNPVPEHPGPCDTPPIKEWDS